MCFAYVCPVRFAANQMVICLLGALDVEPAPEGATNESLESAVGAFDRLCAQAKDRLSQSKGALAAVYRSIFPEGEIPSSTEELTQLFGPGSSTLADFVRAQTVCGSESAFMLMQLHGVVADFEKIVSGFPKKAEMPAIPLEDITERSAKLGKDMIAMMERRTAAAAARATRDSRARSQSAS